MINHVGWEFIKVIDVFKINCSKLVAFYSEYTATEPKLVALQEYNVTEPKLVALKAIIMLSRQN